MRSKLLNSAACPSAGPPAGISPEPLAYGIDAGAEAAGVKRDTVYRAIANGQLTARKIGSRTVILAEDLRAWLASRPVMQPRTPRRGTGRAA